MKVKIFASSIVGLFVAGLAFWFVFSTATVPPHPLSFLLLALVFGVSPIGSFWMLYMVIRHEKHPLPYVLLAFVPYVFVGYYLERVRGTRDRRSERRL